MVGELIWQLFVVFMLLGIAGRLFFLRRLVEAFNQRVMELESALMPSGMMDINGLGKMRVVGLEEFIEEFGFDPRQTEDETLEANVAAVAEWDNAKN